MVELNKLIYIMRLEQCLSHSKYWVSFNCSVSQGPVRKTNHWEYLKQRELNAEVMERLRSQAGDSDTT